MRQKLGHARNIRVNQHYDCSAVLALLILVNLSAGCSSKEKQWISGWRETSSLTKERSGFAIAQDGNRIYIAGGVDGKQFLNSTEWAGVKEDGMLSTWQAGPPMSSERGFFAMVSHRGFLYAVGGGRGENGNELLDSVERAPILPDGGIGAWQVLPQRLTMPRRCARLLMHGDQLLAVGGFAGTSLNTVETTVIKANGDISEWALSDEKLTEPRYVHATAQKHGGAHIPSGSFILGGHLQNKGVGSDSVEWKAEGKAQWEATQNLQTGRYGLSAVVAGDYLLALGGLSGVRYFKTVEKSRLTAQGLSPWSQTTALPAAMAEFGAAVVSEKYIVIIGGTTSKGYLQTVYSAMVNELGDIGFWGYQAQQANVPSDEQNQASLPHKGTVLQVIHGGPYTFLELKHEDETWWIATQGEGFEKGMVLAHGNGVTMRDFYSKYLNRSFDKIVFTGRVATDKN